MPLSWHIWCQWGLLGFLLLSVSSVHPQIPVIYMPRFELCAIKSRPIYTNLIQKPTNLLPLRKRKHLSPWKITCHFQVICTRSPCWESGARISPCWLHTEFLSPFPLLCIFYDLILISHRIKLNHTTIIWLIQYFLPAVTALINLICRIAGICFISSTSRMHFEVLIILSV